jgi:hypothetical protein
VTICHVILRVLGERRVMRGKLSQEVMVKKKYNEDKK